MELLPELIALRRDIHAHPEIGFCEFTTVARLQSWLTSNLRISSFTALPSSKTGFYFDLVGQKASPSPSASSPRCIALRADMDALPSTEANPDLPHRATCSGAHHGCGHDGHMTCLVAAAAVVHSHLAELPAWARVRFFFQPAEEALGGALPMIEDGLLEGVDEVYGFHNWPAQPVGTLTVCSGPFMGHCCEFRVHVRGQGVHASQPHLGRDPILCAASMIPALHTIVSRNVYSAENAVLSVGYIRGGEAHNVIPDAVVFGGTIRDLKPCVFDTICRRFTEVCEGTAKAFGCEVEVKLESGYDCVVNHKRETEIVKSVARKVLGEDKVNEDGLPVLAGEDFAYYLQKKPGCFFFLGSRHENVPKSPTLHNSKYDFNDKLIPVAADLWYKLVLNRFGLFDA